LTTSTTGAAVPATVEVAVVAVVLTVPTTVVAAAVAVSTTAGGALGGTGSLPPSGGVLSVLGIDVELDVDPRLLPPALLALMVGTRSDLCM